MPRKKKAQKKVPVEWGEEEVLMSELEAQFISYMRFLAPELLPLLEREYLFARPERKVRADFAFSDEKILIEIEGIWGTSRHRTPGGYHNDCEKYNLAGEKGYIVLRYTSIHIKNNPVGMIEQVKRVWESRRI